MYEATVASKSIITLLHFNFSSLLKYSVQIDYSSHAVKIFINFAEYELALSFVSVVNATVFADCMHKYRCESTEMT